MFAGMWMFFCLIMPPLWFIARTGLLGSEAQAGAEAARGPLLGGLIFFFVLLILGAIGITPAT